jgi:hypothetical protein
VRAGRAGRGHSAEQGKTQSGRGGEKSGSHVNSGSGTAVRVAITPEEAGVQVRRAGVATRSYSAGMSYISFVRGSDDFRCPWKRVNIG